ncbi:MAG: barstar family protein [Lachnospira sp.]|nr:barstar family protein [Lachnospira sp.]
MNHTRVIPIDAAAFTSRDAALLWFRENLSLPAAGASNLDALYDTLTEVNEDVTFTAGRNTVSLLVTSPSAWTLLKILTRAADENPHIHFLFR